MTKTIITGVLGQDGSYLAEHLLEQGEVVYGITRRKSSDPDSFGPLNHLKENENFKLIHGDIVDPIFMTNLIKEIKPDKFFSLAAQSHVGYSFQTPDNTFETDALSVVRILSAIKNNSPETRFYQASTSELFGGLNCPKKGYTEESLFHPRSPYGVAKLAAHWSTINFREAYGLFSCAGILFNHECLTDKTPIIIKKNGIIDILPIEEVVPHRESPCCAKKYTKIISDESLEVWDGKDWAKVKTLTATWNDKTNDKKVHRILSRGGFYEATADHISFLDGEKEIRTSELNVGDKIQLKSLPDCQNITSLTNDEAELLGLICFYGSVYKKSNNFSGKFINKDLNLIEKVRILWEKVSGGSTSLHVNKSGYKKDSDIFNLSLNGNSNYLRMIHKELYTEKGKSRVPIRILNSSETIMLAFLRGFNLGDGTKAGRQKTEFKCFTTDSHTLALGLWYLVENALKLRMTLYTEERDDRIYFKININSPLNNRKGKHLIKDLNEIKKIKQIDYTGWLFDLETSTGTFSAGIGNTWVHNSPRRPPDFVTRKVTNGVARIIAGKQAKLIMGNLDSFRDWGYAKDYVKMMNLMLESEKPEEFVIATGKTHSIRELLELAFGLAGIKNWEDYVEYNENFSRPSEVDYLLGDASKAKEKLGWVCETSFEELIQIMLKQDLKSHGL